MTMTSSVTNSVVSGLYESARRFAQRAAGDLADGRHDDAMANAGIALEHMAKAFLASEHPLLLVGSKQGAIDLVGMQWALGRPTRASSTGITITATEAIRRAGALVPKLTSKGLRPVLDARNGILHVGMAPESDAESVVSQVARAAEILLPKISRDSKGLWGNYYEAITGRLDKRRNAIANRVADKLAASKDAWEKLRARLGSSDTELLQGAAASRAYDDDEQAVTCPSCGSDAIGSGTIEIQEEPEVDHDGPDWYVSGVSLIPFMHLEALRCPVCGLALEGEEEFRAAGIETDFQSERSVDPRDYYGYE